MPIVWNVRVWAEGDQGWMGGRERKKREGINMKRMLSYPWLCARVHMCVCVCVRACLCLRIHIYSVYINMHTYTYMCVYMQMSLYVLCMYVCTPKANPRQAQFQKNRKTRPRAVSSPSARGRTKRQITNFPVCFVREMFSYYLTLHNIGTWRRERLLFGRLR